MSGHEIGHKHLAGVSATAAHLQHGAAKHAQPSSLQTQYATKVQRHHGRIRPASRALLKRDLLHKHH
jgi:hypothetical protein